MESGAGGYMKYKIAKVKMPLIFADTSHVKV